MGQEVNVRDLYLWFPDIMRSVRLKYNRQVTHGKDDIPLMRYRVDQASWKAAGNEEYWMT